MHGCATFASMLGEGENAANEVRCMGTSNVVTRVELGDYVDTILAVAKEIGAGIIVVGGVADPPMSHRSSPMLAVGWRQIRQRAAS